jgi:hypothetical protein
VLFLRALSLTVPQGSFPFPFPPLGPKKKNETNSKKKKKEEKKYT